MRRIYHFLLAATIAAAPMPVAAQVSVDLNALNGLGAPNLPAPPPGAPASFPHYHRRHRLARGEQVHGTAAPGAVASASQTPAGPGTIEHRTNLGPSFNSLPALPGAAPAVPPTPVLVNAPPPASPPTKAAPPKPVETASATPKAASVPKPAVPPPASPSLALPGAAPPPALAHTPATRLAEATPAPPAAQPAAPPPAAPNVLPKGADRLTLPFSVEESDLPAAENAMLRDFAERYGDAAQYIIRAFATPPTGDDDPSTPRRIALARAQSVAAALMASGVHPEHVRLLALGDAGGAPADRVEVIAMPPQNGHTNTDSSP